MANSFGVASKPSLNVADTNTLTQQGLNSNLSMDPQVIAAMQQYGPQYGAAVLAANQGSNPNLKNLSDLLNSQMAGAQTGIPTALSQYTQNAFRNAQAAKGFGDSPASSLSEAQTMGSTYADYINNLLTQGNNFARNPGNQMTGDQLQQGLGLQLPTVQQAYQNQFNGQEYQNNVNLATTNMSNARNQQSAQIYATLGGDALAAATGNPMPLIGQTGGTTKDMSDSSLTPDQMLNAGNNATKNLATPNNYLNLGTL